MKKFFLLMALVLTAGVVQAQGNTPNFGSRANLTEAKRANSRVSGPVTFTWTQNNKYYDENLFDDVQNAQNIEQGQTMASTYENFVIRVSGLTSDSPYSVEFYNLNNGQEELLKTFTYWKDDVHISPLRAVFTDENEINKIHRVKLKSSCNNGSLILEEAYFISALKELDFKDKDGIDIGNAYIDPSYLIRSNRMWVDIKPDRSFYIHTKAGSEDGTLALSVPYKTGIDVSDITFTSVDFDRTANVFNRNVYFNTIRYFTENKDPKGVLIRELYNSRYSGAFYDAEWNNAQAGVDYFANGSHGGKARQHANDIYWQMHAFTTTEDRSVWVQNICFTKNTIKARSTRKGLEANDWVDQSVYGFRNRDYIVQPYYISGTGPDNGEFSDVVRGDWNSSNKYNYTDLSKYKRMRIIGSPNTEFDIRYATELDGYQTVHGSTYPTVKEWKEITVKTDAKSQLNDSILKYKYGAGEVVIDLDYLKAKANSSHLYLQAVIFHGIYGKGADIGQPEIVRENNTYPAVAGLRDKMWVNNIELYESEGRLVDLHGSIDPTDTKNMYHVWNNDNNYQWKYGTIVRWAAVTGGDWGTNFEQKNYSENSPANCSDGDVIWGTAGFYPEYYADLTGYKAIRVYGTSGQVRFVFNTMRNGKAPYLNDNSDYLDEAGKGNHDGYKLHREQRYIDIIDHNDEKGNYIGTYAELDLSNFEFVHLNGIKAEGDVSGITAIKLVEDEELDYVYYGNGSYFEQGRAPIHPSANMATNDLTAKVIDARARCNNMQVPYNYDLFGSVDHITLPKTASQNVLFISRKGQFNRRKISDHLEYQTRDDSHILYDPNNIITGDPNIYYDSQTGKPKTKIVDDVEDFNLLAVSGAEGTNEYTCTNIKLLDGLSFYAPKKIKANQATFTRTFKNTKAAVNSIILPFAVSAGVDNTYGFYETNVTLKSTTNEGKVGILKDEDVNEGDWLLQFTKTTGNTKANIPYLYAVASGGEVVFDGVKESGTVIIPETPDVQVPAHKNMTNNLPNAENPTYDFYLRGVYEGTYMEHILFYGADGTFYRTPFMTVTPFRTIIKSPIDVIKDGWKDSQDAYFTTPASGVKIVLAFNPHDDSSDINEVVADGLFAEDEPIYNVAGQRVNTFGKGIYIVGGKKILVK